MRQILSVRPLRQIQRTATRFEGQLLKRSRFLGWKTVWVCIFIFYKKSLFKSML